MKKIITGLVLLATVCACNNDEEVNKFDASVVQKADNFIDTRDNTEYSCVRIGNQIWMTENLRYMLPNGPLDGCYTWGEDAVTSNNFPILNGDYEKVVMELGNDQSYNWTKLYGKYFVMKDLPSVLGALNFYPQLEVTKMVGQVYPEFYKALLPKLDQHKIAAAIAHLKNQEKVNGGYSKNNGYLYTLLAALKAVPTEGGWRLPTDEDWLKLEATIGMDGAEAEQFEAWRGVGIGTLLKKGGATGLDIRLSGGNLYTVEKADYYLHKEEYGYYWTPSVHDASDILNPPEKNDSTALPRTTVVMRSFASFSDKIWRGSIRVNGEHYPVKCSVRLVRDAN